MLVRGGIKKGEMEIIIIIIITTLVLYHDSLSVRAMTPTEVP